MYINRGTPKGYGCSGTVQKYAKMLFSVRLNDFQVALRRQQAQEEAEARQLGIKLLREDDDDMEADTTDCKLQTEGT